MRVFWRTLAVLGGVVVLLLIAIAIAVRTVDVKEFVGPLQQRVKQSTGRDLEVHGGIALKLGLEPKLVLNDVTLSNAPWGKQPQMVSAKHVEAQIALLPLLRRHFEVVSFKLVEPNIALETDASGRRNWEFGGAPAAEQGSTPAPSGGTLGGLLVDDIAISDGMATFRDGKTGETTTILIEDLSVHARDAQSPISGRFRGKVNDTAVALEGDFGPLEQVMRQRWPYPVAVQGEISGKKASLGTQVTVKGNTIGFEQLKIGSGSSTLSGKMELITGGPRPKLNFTLEAATFSLADFALPVKASAGKAAAPRSRYVFGEEPIDVAALKDFDSEGEIKIGTLALSDGRHVDQVQVRLTLVNGGLDVPVLRADVLGGSVAGHLRLDAARAPQALLTLHAEAKNLDLGAIIATVGVKRELQGGKTELKADLTAHGASERQWAASANGNVLVLVGPATIVNPKGSTDVALDRLLEAVNPFRSVDPTTQLQCVVIRLPLKDGIAAIDRSIAAETSKLGATASGTIDFRNETLDLSFKPQIRQGIPVAVPQVAELVRFHGPFTSPAVGIDATAAASTVARLGAAVYTGGLSIVGESLFDKAAGDPGAPCQIALGRGGAAVTAANKSSPTTNPAANASDGLNKALGGLFHR